MRILFLTSHFPFPAHSGGALRAYGLIKGTVEAGHQVDLFCFANDIPDATPLHDLCSQISTVAPPVRHGRDRLRDIILTNHADMGRRFWSDEALNRLRTQLQTTPYDIIHAESIEMAAYLIPIHQWYPNLPLIYGSLNAEADLQRSMYATDRRYLRRLPGAIYSWIQWRRLTRLESHICDISAHVLAVSEPDQALLQELSGTPVTVVKNGIEVSNYLHIERSDELGDRAIVFTGSMDYRPNIDAALWFAEDILPHIQDAQFYVVGHRPHKRLSPLREREEITITGRVESMEPYWAGAAVYVAPLRMGSGTRFKIMEAMAAGCAVVSTTIGAQGLGVTSGRELILADTAAEFAEAVEKLLNDPERRAELAAVGRAFVEEYFDWSVIVPNLLHVYDALQ